MISTLYVTIKYPLNDWRVGVVYEEHELAIKYYQDSLILKREAMNFGPPSRANPNCVNFVDRES